MPPSDPRTDDLGFARVDVDRVGRTGDPEVVFGQGKTPAQVVDLLATLHERHPDRAVLATRLSDEALALVAAELPAAGLDAVARAATLGPLPAPRGRVRWSPPAPRTRPWPRRPPSACAPTAPGRGASTTSGWPGCTACSAVREDLAAADALVVVAGMEGALPSVVGGLVGVPLVAVPTSVGYGASFGGLAALLGMLNSCAPGVRVVNIDNGYGAGVLRGADRPAERAAPSTAATGRPGEPLDRRRRGRERGHAARALLDAGRAARGAADGGGRRVPEPVVLRVEQVTRAALAATRCHVEVADSTTHRTWRDVRRLIADADLDEDVRAAAHAAFARLAAAEGAAHGHDPDDVHFHEVGALDAIADVVGACAGLAHLRERHGGPVVVSQVGVGAGRVRAAHGSLPVPVPAVVGAAARRPVVRRPARQRARRAVHADRGRAARRPRRAVGPAARDGGRRGRHRRRWPRPGHPRERRADPRRPGGGRALGGRHRVRPRAGARGQRRRPRPAPVARRPRGADERRRRGRLAHPDHDEEGPARAHALGAGRAPTAPTRSARWCSPRPAPSACASTP